MWFYGNGPPGTKPIDDANCITVTRFAERAANARATIRLRAPRAKIVDARSLMNESGLPLRAEEGGRCETPGGGRSRRSRFPAGAADTLTGSAEPSPYGEGSPLLRITICAGRAGRARRSDSVGSHAANRPHRVLAAALVVIGPRHLPAVRHSQREV